MTLKTYNNLVPFGAVPNERQMMWYTRGKTAFIHFGINTFTNLEWGDGTESPTLFNPTQLDCRQWLSVLKKAGFTCAILTAKHHDGFCLWPSRYTEHSVKNSPYKDGKGDVVREFVDACREYDIQAGIYLSPWDRNFSEWGTEKYNDYYAAQLTELMTEYGDIYECWWDGAGSTEAKYDWERWVNIIRENQPNCVIFGSLGATSYVDVRWVGNELGKAGDPCWATIDESSLRSEITRELNKGKCGGARFIPAESNTSIRPGWFYHPEQDGSVRTPVNLTHYWFTSAGKNTGILLNIPPDKRGLISDIDAQNLQEWNRNMNRIFENNLLKNAEVFVEDAVCDEYAVHNLLEEDEDKVYASKSLNPTITFQFSEETSINCICLEEVIELGHRVRKFQVEYLKDGVWETLIERECIGFCRGELFETVTTAGIRVRILDSGEMPILRFCGAYLAPDECIKEPFENKKDIVELTKMPTTRVIRHGDEYEIELGGIFEYNTVICDASDSFAFEIFAFNGSQYEAVYYNINGTEHEICQFSTVEGSYKLKVVFYECPIEKERKIQVLNV